LFKGLTIFVFFISLFLIHFESKSQNISSIGKYPNHYFSVNDFGSASQIWTGTQGSDGILYFGNDDEILSFNGYKWVKLKIVSRLSETEVAKKVHKSKVTKLFTSSNGITYVGRKDNFGFLSYSDSGEVRYQPIFSPSQENDCGQIWNIIEAPSKEIIFIGENQIYRLENKKVLKIDSPDSFKGYLCRTSGRIGNGIILIFNNIENRKEKKYGYYDFNTRKIKEIQLPSKINLVNLRGSFDINGIWYLFDSNGYIFSLSESNGSINWYNAKQLENLSFSQYNFHVVKRRNNYIYFGTIEHGVIVTDLNFNIVRRFDKYFEMKSTSIYDIFQDRDGNAWFCLQNGIHLFETSSPVTSLTEKEVESTTILDVNFIQEKEVLSTNIDVLLGKQNKIEKTFTNTQIFKEDVYEVKSYKTDFDEKTIAVTFSGVFLIDLMSLKKTDSINAFAWTTYQNPLNKNELFVGLETGLGKITFTNNKMLYEEILDLNGDIIKFSHSQDYLIFGAKNNGVYLYDLKTGKHKEIKIKGLKNEKTHYYVENFQNKIYVGLESGLYVLSNDFKNLIPFKEINGKFYSGDGTIQIHRIYNQRDKKLWLTFYSEQSKDVFEIETGYLEIENQKWNWTSWPLTGLKAGGINHSIKESKDGSIWFGGVGGLYIYNPEVEKTFTKDFNVSISAVEVNNKQILFNPEFSSRFDALDFEKNTIKFTFHTNSFSGFGKTVYRYKLDGLTDEWSEWSEINFVGFQKLREGNYTFNVQAKNQYQFLSEVNSFSFSILPPWYRTWWAFLSYFILLILLIYFVIQLSIKRIKTQNIKLEEIVKERTSEIAEQNKQLEYQKAEIIHKTNDIVDSIKYAKRIQDTILPSEERLNEMFKEYFVFYRPKDIVSGDFYWARKKQGVCIFSAIDCTGHGVPGALVSIVGNNGLLRCVNEFKLIEPNEILDKLREVVVSSFKATGQEVKDGMDMALCTIDHENMILKFAGANNECVIIRNGEIIELKPDKQPIGYFSHSKPFTLHEFKLEKNDCIYLSTDGYIDQFGGPEAARGGKKFKSKPFKIMLSQIAHLEMEEQYKIVKNRFDEWKGDLEQIDDICVFGVKI
jgi:serine phosphatase RsbU (regulator of sigma subunit)